MVAQETAFLPQVDKSGWPVPADGDMLCDPTSGRVIIYRSGAWQETTAAVAYALATARTISLTGHISGSVSTDLSTDAPIASTVANYQHYHRRYWAHAWFNGSLAIGGSTGAYIPWGGGASSDWGTGHISGTQVKLPVAGWWYVHVFAQAVDKTGAGTRTLELWTNGNAFHAFEAMNSDGAGRWGAHAQGLVLSDGNTWCNPYLWWSIANTCNQAWFSAVWMRQ